MLLLSMSTCANFVVVVAFVKSSRRDKVWPNIIHGTSNSEWRMHICKYTRENNSPPPLPKKRTEGRESPAIIYGVRFVRGTETT